MAVIDLVKWDANDQVYAWKYPSQELSTWTQLIVSESQEAILMREGQMVGPFLPGRYVLDTKNLPILSKIFKIPFGERSPFTAEVWFVNRVNTLDVKWGTPTPIQLKDPEYNIMLPVRAFGQFGVTVSNTKKFLKKLVGTLPAFDREKLVSYFRGIVLSQAKTSIAQQIVKNGVSILEISAQLDTISSALEADMAPHFDEFGLKMLKFMVSSINTPEDDPAVMRLKDALSRKAEMDIVGFNYQQERSFDMMEAAAANPGAAQSGLMGAGIGLGMGVGMGGAMGGAMGQVTNNISVQNQAKCPGCGAMNQDGAIFCSKCGGRVSQVPPPATTGPAPFICVECGKENLPDARFCAGCGGPIRPCPKCKTDVPDGLHACPKCNTPLPVKCKNCGNENQPESSFCPKCGRSTVASCTNCDTVLPPDSAFCPKCGTPHKSG